MKRVEDIRLDTPLIRKFIHDYQHNFKKLKELIKNGEISNPKNLNGPIFLEYTESYGNIVCRYLERFIDEHEK